jgi:ubiquinone/menaquinone biosynthesis C-methylase UbiE
VILGARELGSSGQLFGLVVDMNPSSRFWDKIAKRYAKTPVADEAAYQQKLQVTRTYFRQEMEVLEFGCGTGSTAISHSPYVRHIRAIDISSKMLEIAREKADQEGVENVDFEELTIEDVNIPDQSLDAVLGLSILHLLEIKEDAIAKVHRMLKPGGVFVTSTVCIGDTMKFFKLIAPVGKLLGLMPLLNIFTTDELMASLTDAGFEIDHQWTPGKGKAAFIVAIKAE